jgi:hypothetical protein
LITAWQLENASDLDSSVIYRVDLDARSGLGDRLPPGLYYLEATADAGAVYPEADTGSFIEARERQMIVVSKNNLTLKTSTGESLAWLTDLKDGQPVPCATHFRGGATTTIPAKLHPGALGYPNRSDGVGLSIRAPRLRNRVAFAGDPTAR